MNLEILGFILLIIVLNTLVGLFSKKSNLLYCGIIGFSGVNHFNMDKIKFLSYWNSQERGKDATGFYTPEKGIVKDNTEAKVFFNADKNLNNIDTSDTLIAHVRAKTFGANLPQNAHPFQYGRIVGVHNGTLSNHYEMIWEEKLSYYDYDVDSQVLIKLIDKGFDSGNLADRFKVLSQYEGAAALLLYDEWTNDMYACRDKERPLFYGYVDGVDMYISSIEESLKMIGCLDIKSFPVNIVHKINNGVITEKIPYKSYVPVKTTNTTIIQKGTTATAIDVKYDNNGNYKIAKTFKGIAVNICRVKMLEGFHVRVDSIANLPYNSGKFIIGKWYFCVGSVIKTGHLVESELICIDEEGKEKPLYIKNIDTNNFIPVEGGYVQTLYKIVAADKKAVALKGDICRVVEYSYGDDSLILHNLETDAQITVYTKHIRNMIRQEHDEYAQEVERNLLHKTLLEKALEEKKPTCDINNPLLLGAEDDTNPFIKGPNENDFDIDDDADEDAEIFIGINNYENFILESIVLSESAQMDLNCGKGYEAAEKLEELISKFKLHYNEVEDELLK